MTNLKPTEEQEAFIASFLSKTPCFLSARAGTGKTSTIKMAVEKAIELGWNPDSISAIAYNKANQIDLTNSLAGAIKVQTLHSLGFNALREFKQGLSLESSKIFNLLKEEKIKSREAFVDTFRLVSAAKNWGIVPKDDRTPLCKRSLLEDSSTTWLELQEYFECWSADLTLAREVLIKSNEAVFKKAIIDFDDMVYLPIALGLPIIGSDFLIVDEAQDLSPLNIELLKKTPSKIWYVGDPFQCIYGWRGASSDVIESLGLPVFPLTECWRCSGNIIRAANSFVEDIRTSNPQGAPVIRYSHFPDWKNKKPATILSRTNAGLIKTALRMREDNIKLCIFGRDFAKSLQDILKKLKGTTRKPLLDSLVRWKMKMMNLYPQKEAEILDYYCCLKLFLDKASGKREVENLINNLFIDNPSKDSWILSTIHKAKGKEFETVYILDWKKTNITQPWVYKEERNLHYVAITRAKENLFIIDEQAWKIDSSLEDSSEKASKEFSKDGELLTDPEEKERGLWD